LPRSAEALRPGAVERGDLRDAEQAADEAGEDAGVALLGLEAELQGDVGDRVVVVVDLHLVEDLGIEGKVVRAVGRLEQGIHRQDHGQLGRVVVADERVPVGDVGGAIERGDRRLAVIGREHGQRGRDDRGGHGGLEEGSSHRQGLLRKERARTSDLRGAVPDGCRRRSPALPIREIWP
jgi:hypothetical protein